MLSPALLPIAKVAALPLLTAIIVGSCTASHFRVKINNMELEWQAQVLEAEAEAARQVAAAQAITHEVENEYQVKIADLSGRYADAAGRLQNQARRLRTVSEPTRAANGETTDDGLPVGIRAPQFSVDTEPYLALPLAGTLDLMMQADKNTQQLISLQDWVRRQVDSAQKAPQGK